MTLAYFRIMWPRSILQGNALHIIHWRHPIRKRLREQAQNVPTQHYPINAWMVPLHKWPVKHR
jgi:hypothetical protein